MKQTTARVLVLDALGGNAANGIVSMLNGEKRMFWVGDWR